MVRKGRGDLVEWCTCGTIRTAVVATAVSLSVMAVSIAIYIKCNYHSFHTSDPFVHSVRPEVDIPNVIKLAYSDKEEDIWHFLFTFKAMVFDSTLLVLYLFFRFVSFSFRLVWFRFNVTSK